MFHINISKCPTLPSLAFKIFRTHFMDKNLKLPILVNDIFKDINKSYYGGHVDMYIPENKPGEILNVYDVNSLYPYVMKQFKYPINLLGHFKGDIVNIIEYNAIFNSDSNTKSYIVIIEAPNIKNLIKSTKSINGRTILLYSKITLPYKT